MVDYWDGGASAVDADVHIATDDVSIARRRRALAPIQTLTDLERNKAMYPGGFWDGYDLFNVALATIDQVALAMGISAGRTWDEALDYAAGQAARQRPDASRAEWTLVAERVLVSLVTTDVETVPYLTYEVDEPRWLAQRFRLLYVHTSGPDAVEHLRASEQAINIFVDALDLDIEAAQVASEAQLAALIARGAVDTAVQFARNARYQSIQLLEKVRRIVAETLIDPDTHDWVESVPELLSASLAHVRSRLEAETALLDAVEDQRVRLDDAEKVAAANRVVELLRECRHRHDQLHEHLIGARSRLRDALDDRFDRPARSVHRFDLSSDLLEPFLQLSTAAAVRSADVLVARAGAMSVSWLPTLATLTDELCAPPRERSLGEEVDDAVFDDREDEEAWWEPYEATADALVGGVDEPVRLSQLLARAAELDAVDDDGDSLDEATLATAVVHAAHRAWSAQLSGRSAGDRFVVAVASGVRIRAAGGFDAEDLLVVPATVTSDIATAETDTDDVAVRAPAGAHSDGEGVSW